MIKMKWNHEPLNVALILSDPILKQYPWNLNLTNNLEHNAWRLFNYIDFTESDALDFCRELAHEDKQFSKSKTLISCSFSIRLSV